MLYTTVLALAAGAVIVSAAPVSQARRQDNNVNLVNDSTPVLDKGDGTFQVNIKNGVDEGTLSLTITDKIFALNVACLNDVATKCGNGDIGCQDVTRKTCTQGNDIDGAIAALNADTPSDSTKEDNSPEVILNNSLGTPIITGGPAKELGGGLTGAVDDSKGSFGNAIETPIRAVALQVGCLMDEAKCVAGDLPPEASIFGVTGDCTKDRIACEDASGLTGLSVKINND